MFVQVTAKNVGGVFMRHSVERYSMSTYTELSNFQKTVRSFGPPCS